MNYIKAIETNLNKKAEIILEKMQPGDVKETFADTSSLEDWISYKPRTSIEEGVQKFVDWYKDFFNKKINVQK